MAARALLPRLDSLTGLRFFAAYFVLQHHFTNFAELPILSRYDGFGATGVSFFFVLSGFVLTWSFVPSDTAPRFYWRRFARIVPLHIITTLIAIPVFYTWRGDSVDPLAIILSFTLLHAWVPHASTYFAGNPASWSLSCEAFFYAVHPWLIRPLLRANRLFLATSAVVLGLVAFLVGEWTTGLSDNVVGWLTYISPLFRIGEFFLGMLLAVAMKRGFRLPVGIIPSTVLLGCWFILQYNIGPHLGSDGRIAIVNTAYVALPLLYGMVIASAAGLDLQAKMSPLRHPMMMKLGEWSYSLYLIHATVIYAFVNLLGERSSATYLNVLWLLLISGVCIGCAGLLYQFVEHPLERRLRGMQGKSLVISPESRVPGTAVRP